MVDLQRVKSLDQFVKNRCGTGAEMARHVGPEDGVVVAALVPR